MCPSESNVHSFWQIVCGSLWSTGSGNVNNLKTVSLLEGLEECPSLMPDGLLARKYRTWTLGRELGKHLATL